MQNSTGKILNPGRDLSDVTSSVSPVSLVPEELPDWDDAAAHQFG